TLFLIPPPTISPLFPYTTLFRSRADPPGQCGVIPRRPAPRPRPRTRPRRSFRRPCDTRPSSVARIRLPLRSACSELRVASRANRSEEHTSELQSRENLVCRLLLE